MKTIATLAAAAFAFAAVGCSQTSTPVAEEAPAPAPEPQAAEPASQAAPATQDGYAGKVLETMDSGGYTYVKVDAASGPIWAAAPQFQVAVGDEVVVNSPMPMPGYHSKTLDRTFEMLYFSPAITPPGARPEQAAAAAPGASGAAARNTAAAEVDLSGIAKAEGGHTVGELFERKAELAGKEVVVRGRVVKFNGGIMGKNWIHLRDGTGAEGANDLTVTTQATAAVGDTVLVRGVAVADKDFGYGYKYALILEDAQVDVE